VQVLRPEGLRWAAPRQQAERRAPLMAVRPVQPTAPRSVRRALSRPEAARPGVLADPYRARPARPSAAAARKVRVLQATEEAAALVAQRLAQVERLAPPALQAAVAAAVREAQQALGVSGVQPPEEAEVWDVAAAPQPAAESAGAARRLEAAAVQRRAAGLASAAVRPREAEVAAPGAEEARLREAEVAAPGAEEALLRVAEVLDAAGVPQRVARDEGVLLLAAAWAELPSTRLQGGRLAPSAWAQSAHARGGLRTAQP
jgi:hypothetical protein